MHIIKFACLLLSALLLAGCATNSITGRSQLMLVSEQSAIAQSANAYSSLIGGLSKEGKLSKDKKLIARVQDITDRLITQAVKYRPATQDWKWSVTVIEEPDTVNAFCMAGGKMAIYTGLIDKIKPSDDEIAQVMGHEISHALANHTAEKMSVSMAAGLAVIAATAAANPENRQATQQVSSLAALTLVTLPNSRVAESEADRIGIELAAKAGYDPHAAVTLWEKMMKESGQKSRFDFLSTHPASVKRIEALASLEDKMRPLYEEGRANRKLPVHNWVGAAPAEGSSGGSASSSGDALAPAAALQPPVAHPSKAGSTSNAYRLRELKKLRKDGVISQQEFDSKKRQLLDSY